MLMKKYGMKERTNRMKLASKENEAGKQRGRKREDKKVTYAAVPHEKREGDGGDHEKDIN